MAFSLESPGNCCLYQMFQLELPSIHSTEGPPLCYTFALGLLESVSFIRIFNF